MIAVLSAFPLLAGLIEHLREAVALDMLLIPFITIDLRDHALETAGASLQAAGAFLGGRCSGRRREPRRRLLLLLDELELGGTQRQALLLGKALVARGHRVTLAYFRERGAVLRGDFESAGIETILVPKRRPVDPAFLRRLVRLLRSERHGHAISFGHTANLWTRLAGLLAGSPRPVCCIRNHSCIPELPGRPVLAALEWLLSWRARRVVCNSWAAASAIVGRGIVPRRKISVISNGIDADGFAGRGRARARLEEIAGRPLEGPVIGTLARLVPVKDLGTLLRAARDVKERIPGATFVLGGDGPERPALERLRDALGLGGGAILPGSLSGREVLSGLDLAVLTSLEEGSPNFLLEAMALGVPAVATGVGEIPALLGEGERGWLVPPGDPGRLAAAIFEALGDPAALRARAARARSFASRRTPARLASAYLSLLPPCRPARSAPEGAAADPS